MRHPRPQIHASPTTRQPCCEKVMFSVVSVILFMGGGGSLYGEGQCIMGNGDMGTSNMFNLDFSVQVTSHSTPPPIHMIQYRVWDPEP